MSSCGQPPRRATAAKPLLIGEWADIGVLRDGDDYYLVHSSGLHRPAVLIWHSRDLKTWRPKRYAVLNHPGCVWLTDLAKIDGRYYILFLSHFRLGGGFYVVADSMDGPWSEPRPTNLPPDAVLAADDDGSRWLFSGQGSVTPLASRVPELRAIGETRKVYDGWPIPEDWATEMSPCLEGPKVLKRGGWWHLIEAEGGTFGPSTSHMVVAARARHPLGPWENSPHNPIIRTHGRREPWWSKGHGQLIEGPDGQWYCILHGIRRHFRTLGRGTLIEPIQWTEDGWFRVADEWPTGWERPVRVEMPMSDDFALATLGIQWQFFGPYDPTRFTVGEGRLCLSGRGASPADSQPLTLQPMHAGYELEVDVELEGEGMAGLMLFTKADCYIGTAVCADGVLRRVDAGYKHYEWAKDPAVGRRRVELRIVNDRQDARFYYKDDGQWRLLQPSMEVSFGSSPPFNLRPTLFACGAGRGVFRRFVYRPLPGDDLECQ